MCQSRFCPLFYCFNPRPRAGGDSRARSAFQNSCCFNPRPRAGGDDTVLSTRTNSQGFQSTPPRGGRQPIARPRLMLVVVSIHAPARGATRPPKRRRRSYCCFNPRPRAGGDGLGSMHRTWSDGFQSTPPRGGRRYVRRAHSHDIQSFNPRPRAGGDVGSACAPRRQDVSIHAPARGATAGPASRRSAWRCFNPRPRAGGDPELLERIHRHPRFNPRPRAGGDARPHTDCLGSYRFQSTPPRGGRHSPASPTPSLRSVSIHAPARGATDAVHLAPPNDGRFNPRPRAGGDRLLAIHTAALIAFQSTPPRGGRRPHTSRNSSPQGVSIHAPARGATLFDKAEELPEGVSIHAPARGATYAYQNSILGGGVSIHAPARGAT